MLLDQRVHAQEISLVRQAIKSPTGEHESLTCEQYTSAILKRVGDPATERGIGQDRLLRIQAANVEYRETITKKRSTVDHRTQPDSTL